MYESKMVEFISELYMIRTMPIGEMESRALAQTGSRKILRDAIEYGFIVSVDGDCSLTDDGLALLNAASERLAHKAEEFALQRREYLLASLTDGQRYLLNETKMFTNNDFKVEEQLQAFLRQNADNQL